MKRLLPMVIASTCLGAAAPGASALPTYNEVEPNNTLATADVTPVGTTNVLGIAEITSSSFTDFYQFTGLNPAAMFSATINNVNQAGFFSDGLFQASTSSGASITSAALGVSPNYLQQITISGVIPTNGILILSIVSSVMEGGSFQYGIALTAPLAPTVPEPGTLGLLGSGLLALAGLGAANRRTKG
jgi:hypothetical protein